MQRYSTLAADTKKGISLPAELIFTEDLLWVPFQFYTLIQRGDGNAEPLRLAARYVV